MASIDLRWHPEAIQEAYETRDWYARRSILAARGYLLALDQAVEAVLEAPMRYPKAEFGCREFVFPNQYPYTLVYRILTDEVLEVVAVAGQKQRPQYWRYR